MTITTSPTKSGSKWASINRPVAVPTHDKVLPVGDKPLQLYSLDTPNGVKITVMLEELLALGKTDAAYDLQIVNIGECEMFGSPTYQLEDELYWRQDSHRQVRFLGTSFSLNP